MAAEEPRKLTRSEQKALRQQAKATLAAPEPEAAQPEEGGEATQLTRRERKLLAKQQKEALVALIADNEEFECIISADPSDKTWRKITKTIDGEVH
eukprot:COSAG02_NODE_13384_length_1401_cov_1.495392_2_plen_95_part_01